MEAQPYAVEHMVSTYRPATSPGNGGSVSTLACPMSGPWHYGRAGMVGSKQDRIRGKPGPPCPRHGLVDGLAGEGRGVHHKVLVACAVEVLIGYREPRRTSERTDAMPGWQAGRPRSERSFVGSRRAPTRNPARQLIGVHMPPPGPGMKLCVAEMRRRRLPAIADHPSRFANLNNVPSAASLSAISASRPGLNRSSRRWNTLLPTKPSAPQCLGIEGGSAPTFDEPIQGNGSTLHVVGECVNRIGKER